MIWFKDQKNVIGKDKQGREYTEFSFPYSKFGSDERIGRVLRYGDGIEIMEPKELREEIKEKIESMRGIY